MGNHQMELAEQLAKDQHLVYGSSDDVRQVSTVVNSSSSSPGHPRLQGQERQLEALQGRRWAII